MRTIDVDDAWVEERSNKIADNALDLSQVEAIRKQVSRTTYGEAYDLEGDKNTQKRKWHTYNYLNNKTGAPNENRKSRHHTPSDPFRIWWQTLRFRICLLYTSDAADE